MKLKQGTIKLWKRRPGNNLRKRKSGNCIEEKKERKRKKKKGRRNPRKLGITKLTRGSAR